MGDFLEERIFKKIKDESNIHKIMREIIFCGEYNLIKFSILVKNYSLMKYSVELSNILQGGSLSSKGWLSLPLLQAYQEVSGKSLLPHLK